MIPVNCIVGLSDVKNILYYLGFRSVRLLTVQEWDFIFLAIESKSVAKYLVPLVPRMVTLYLEISEKDFLESMSRNIYLLDER